MSRSEILCLAVISFSYQFHSVWQEGNRHAIPRRLRETDMIRDGFLRFLVTAASISFLAHGGCQVNGPKGSLSVGEDFMRRRVHPWKRSVSWVNSVLRQFLANGPISCLPLGIVIKIMNRYDKRLGLARKDPKRSARQLPKTHKKEESRKTSVIQTRPEQFDVFFHWPG